MHAKVLGLLFHYGYYNHSLVTIVFINDSATCEVPSMDHEGTADKIYQQLKSFCHKKNNYVISYVASMLKVITYSLQ